MTADPRIEAAATAVHELYCGTGRTGQPDEFTVRQTKAALTAADAVMFSEEAIGKARLAVRDAVNAKAFHTYEDIVRVVVASFRGES